MLKDTFLGFDALQTLDLSSTSIPCLQDGVFNGLHNLLNLDLSFTSISYLQDGVFNGLHNLLNLDLSLSSISSLHDGVFNGLHNLLNLDLSHNIISFIEEATFTGLSKLKHLDLSNQNSTLFIASPFQNLGSLETLIVETRNVSSATFTGLTSLQELQVRNVEFLHDDSLSRLPSLLYLTLELETCNFTEMLLNGLHKLEYLSITFGMECRSSNVDFCPLVSLQTLDVSNLYMLNLTNDCLKKIPMKSLLLNTLEPNKQTVSFEMLNNLSSLSWTTGTDSYASTRALNSLDSPLQNLYLYQSEHLTLNSTTFELCQEWSESLQNVEIHVDGTIFINGSPFAWFPKLLVLKLSTYSRFCKIQTLSNITFSGLSSLEELHINLCMLEHLASGTLDIFGLYNSLKILDLSQNDMKDDDKLTHQICNINTSLEKLDLSSNEFTFTYDYPCTLPNLKILDVGNQYKWHLTSGLCLDNVFHVVPNLNVLRIYRSPLELAQLQPVFAPCHIRLLLK